MLSCWWNWHIKHAWNMRPHDQVQMYKKKSDLWFSNTTAAMVIFAPSSCCFSMPACVCYDLANGNEPRRAVGRGPGCGWNVGWAAGPYDSARDGPRRRNMVCWAFRPMFCSRCGLADREWEILFQDSKKNYGRTFHLKKWSKFRFLLILQNRFSLLGLRDFVFVSIWRLSQVELKRTF